MPCASCASINQIEFPCELGIQFHGLKNLDRPTVLLFPHPLVCVDCGFSSFNVPEAELQMLRNGL
jgi:hypothetical protein